MHQPVEMTPKFAYFWLKDPTCSPILTTVKNSVPGTVDQGQDMMSSIRSLQRIQYVDIT